MQQASAISPKTLLLISSEPQRFQDTIAKLEMFGEFRIKHIASWNEAAEQIGQNTYDIVLVDYQICEAGEAAACNFLRRHDSSIPIIVFADEFSKTELVLCLNSGANDYVTSADDPVVIAARIRAQIRARSRDGQQRTRVGNFWFIRDQRALLDVYSEKTVPLTVREADLVAHLALYANTTVGVEDIYRKVWHHRGPINSHTVQTHIYRLRQKIEQDPSNPKILVSTGSGYCLVVEAITEWKIGVEA